MDDYPSKAEARGSRKKRRERNPYARDLSNPKYRQRVNRGGKRRGQPEVDDEYGTGSSDPLGRSFYDSDDLGN